VYPHSTEPRRIVVWIQRFKDREDLVLQWHHPETGKRCSKSAGTSHRGLAEMKRTDLEYQLNHGLHQEASRMSWEKFRELFEAEYVAPLRDKTRRNYAQALDHFEAVAGPTRVGTITGRTISQFVAGLRQLPGRKRGSTLSPSTVDVTCEFLRSALSWAQKQKLIVEVPEFPRIDVPEAKPRPVAVEAFERLLDRAPDAEMRGFLLCGWLAGLRLHEAFLLEWEETDRAPYLDPAGHRIVLPARFAKGKRDQWLPLDPVLAEELSRLPRHGGRVFHFTGRQGRPVGLKAMTARVVRLARKAGVKLTMHTLRKGFGCRYAGRVPAQVLQKLMRHASIKTTMDYYANIDDAVMDAVLGVGRNTSRNTAGQLSPDAPGGLPQDSAEDGVAE
jgi:integrase